ncbi:MAG: PEGA domain-containing protein [Verrucomicrobiae bacterium]|nr:PEGA domain-containing protein [Verrucomicrobiae bacterium]
MRILFQAFVVALAAASLAGCLGQPEASVPGIKVDSDPPGAVLSLNGKEVGRTPYFWRSPPAGKALLQFAWEGYEPLDRMVTVDPSALSDIVVKLERFQGLVLFQSVPNNAEVTVDGAFKGKTPLLSCDLPSGKHKAVFRLEGYDPREMDLEIRDRTPQICAMNMRSIHATLRVESAPPGAAVMLDGIHKGQTPCAIEDVLIGDHKLKLVREGYKDFETNLRVPQTGVLPVSVQLEEKYAVLDIVSAPPDARVTLNQEFKGRTPLQISSLQDGAYTVTIEKPGYDKITREVKIARNQDAKVDVSLEKNTGLMALNVSPSGSAISVDGDFKGASAEGPFTLELPPGNYRVDVSRTRHRPQSFTVAVVARKTAARDVVLQKIWVKDTILVLRQSQRVREGMLIEKYPNGSVRLETSPGIFEEYSAGEILSVAPAKTP